MYGLESDLKDKNKNLLCHLCHREKQGLMYPPLFLFISGALFLPLYYTDKDSCDCSCVFPDIYRYIKLPIYLAILLHITLNLSCIRKLQSCKIPCLTSLQSQLMLFLSFCLSLSQFEILLTYISGSSHSSS
jgi:hypothetical protein